MALSLLVQQQLEVMNSGGLGDGWLSVRTCMWITRTQIKPEAAACICTHWALTGQLSGVYTGEPETPS